MKALFAIGVFALAAVVSAEEIKLGTGVTLKEATPIAALTEKPAEYLGTGSPRPYARAWAAGWRWRLTAARTQRPSA